MRIFLGVSLIFFFFVFLIFFYFKSDSDKKLIEKEKIEITEKILKLLKRGLKAQYYRRRVILQKIQMEMSIFKGKRGTIDQNDSNYIFKISECINKFKITSVEISSDFASIILTIMILFFKM